MKDKMYKECSGLFYEPGFEEKLDSNPSLLGFENGVFDLENNVIDQGVVTFFKSQLIFNLTFVSSAGFIICVIRTIISARDLDKDSTHFVKATFTLIKLVFT